MHVACFKARTVDSVHVFMSVWVYVGLLVRRIDGRTRRRVLGQLFVVEPIGFEHIYFVYSSCVLDIYLSMRLFVC